MKEPITDLPTLAELLKVRRAYRAALQAVEREIADRLESDRDAEETETRRSNQGLTGQAVVAAQSANEPPELPNGELCEKLTDLNEILPHDTFSFTLNESLPPFDEAPFVSPAQVRDEQMEKFFKQVAEPGLAEFCREMQRSNIESRIFRTRQARRVIAGTSPANTCRFEVWIDFQEIRLTSARHVPQGNDSQVTGKRGRGAYVTSPAFAERRYSRSDMFLITPTMIAATFLANFRELNRIDKISQASFCAFKT